jgi:hypothetical protein
MERLLFDLRLALRQLVWSPGFSIAAVLILALGIGTSSAVFSVVDSILFRPLLLPDSERLVTLCEAHGGDRAYCTACAGRSSSTIPMRSARAARSR